MVTWIRWVLAVLLLATSAVCFAFRNPFGGALCAVSALSFYLLHARLGKQARFAPAAVEAEGAAD